MCIIAHGLRKNFPEDEFKECLKTNPAGFFLAAIRAHDGTRTIAEAIRTLDSGEAVRKFEELQPEDEIVLHARIPSRGGKNIENVHGWKSEEGVYFCHNGTMSNIKTWGDHTDSETFFRKFFLPCWRGEGRQFTENVEFLIQQFLGYSKFCFILPDGTVKLYGEYRKDHNMDYSNGSYKVYVPAPVTQPRCAGGFRSEWDEDSTWRDNDDGDGLYGYYGHANDSRRDMTVSAPRVSGGTREFPASAGYGGFTSVTKGADQKPKGKTEAKAKAKDAPKPATDNEDVDRLFAEAARFTTAEDILDVTPALVAKVLRGFLDHYMVANYLANFDFIMDAVDGKEPDSELRDAVGGLICGLLDGTWLDDDFDVQAGAMADMLADYAERLGDGMSVFDATASLLRDYEEWLTGQFPEYRFAERAEKLRVNNEAIERLLGIGVGIDTGYLSGSSIRPCAARYNRKAAWTRTESVRAELMIAPADAKPAEVGAATSALNKLAVLIVALEKERKW